MSPLQSAPQDPQKSTKIAQVKGFREGATDPFDIPNIVSTALDTRNYYSVRVSCNRGIRASKSRILLHDREGMILGPGDEEPAYGRRKT